MFQSLELPHYIVYQISTERGSGPVYSCVTELVG